MELVKLKSDNTPGAMVENYDSLIWTERFNTIGEFQIQTGQIDYFMDLLPEGTVLSLRESNVPMIVETRQITRPKGKGANLLIKGRPFESILDRRVAAKAVDGSGGEWQVVVKTPSDAAYYSIVKICVEGMLDAKDIFPSTIVQFLTPADYLAGTGPNKLYTIPRGSLFSAVMTMLQTEAIADPTTTPATPAVVQHGIRSVRPDLGGAVGVQIYTGTDRTSTVRFDAQRDALDDGTYLFSKVGSATDAYILGTGNAVKLTRGDSSPSGMDRRVILVDGTSSGIGDVVSLTEQGKASMAEAKETALFDGSLNQDLSEYKYNIHYGLGDVVSLVGDYGLSAKARVTEYIRSSDKNGEKSYPTLVTIDK